MAIDGEYTGKRRFLIFDYCGNFEFFRQKSNGYESADTKSLSESIFCKQVRIAAALQDGAYADENYQNWRKILTEIPGQLSSGGVELYQFSFMLCLVLGSGLRRSLRD